MFSCEFCEISKNTFYPEDLWMTASVEKDSSVSTHERNVQILATERYKASNNFSPLHLNEIRLEDPYNLRRNSTFSRPLAKSLYNGTENLI